MRGKRYSKEQLVVIAGLFKQGKRAEEIGAMFGVTGVAMRKLRHRMRSVGWDVGVGSCGNPMPRPEVG